jgi:fucose 4-O-acetylase-like acetyltransferase
MFSHAIDRTKGLAILLVVLGHINSPLSAYIYTFHIPLFFFLSGVFIKTSYPGSVYVTRGLNRLIVPFLIFGSLGLLITAAKNVLLDRPLEPMEESLSGLFYWMDASHMHHYGLVLWFLPALFWGRTIVYFIVKFIPLPPLVLSGASIFVAWIVAQYVTLPFGLDKGLVALPWVFMGYVFYQNHERLMSLGWYGVFMILGAVVLSALLGGMQRLDLAAKDVGNLLLTIPYTISVALLLIGLLYLGSTVSNRYLQHDEGVLGQFGRNTMLVLVLHVYSNNAADIIVNRVLGSGYWLVTFFLSVSVVFVAIRIKQRYSTSFAFKYL